jgi:hypothetical protein
MRKVLLGLVMVAIALVALGTAGTAYAQTPAPGYGAGNGKMGGSGGMMGGRLRDGQTGPLHDEMVAAFAEKLGISADELNSPLASGETMAQIAASKGLTADQFTSLMQTTRNQAIDEAVKNGELTQAQADRMKQCSARMMKAGRGLRGGNANPACPYYSANH